MARLMKLVRHNIVPKKVEIEDIENAELIAEFECERDALDELKKYKSRWSDKNRIEIMLAEEDGAPVECVEQYFVDYGFWDAELGFGICGRSEWERHEQGLLGELNRMIAGDRAPHWRGVVVDTILATQFTAEICGVDAYALVSGEMPEIKGCKCGARKELEKRFSDACLGFIDGKDEADLAIRAINKVFGLELD